MELQSTHHLRRTRIRADRWAALWGPLRRALATLAPLAALAFLVGGPAQAQVPKSDSRTWYVDDSLYGFKVKVPKDWEFVPPQPDETALIGKYDPPTNKFITVGNGENLFLHCWLVVLDNRPQPEASEEDDDDVIIIGGGRSRYRTPLDWIDARVSGINWRLEDEEDLRAKDRDVEARALTFVANTRSGEPDIQAYAAVYELEPQLELMLVFNGPAGRRWRNYEKAFEKMAKSLERVEIEEPEEDLEAMAASANPRDRKRARLLDEIRREPGWQLYETENYLVVSSSEDDEFVEELMERVEAIRDIFVADYPPESARRAVPTEGEDEEEDEEELRSRSTTDPFLEARASVIRVCNNQAQYHSYGGPGGSAGYWSSRDEELVIYDDQAGGGRDDTWAVLNHEAFHQYIFYFYGKLAPHSWYNEGTGDFYSGYEYRHRRFRLNTFDWREQTIKNMIREDQYVPLDEIVRWTQAQYYSGSEYGTGPGEHYAQGWSFIYFMRTGPEECRDWNPEWDSILDTYLVTLAETGDLDEAVDVAFEGVDWNELDEAWKGYIL